MSGAMHIVGLLGSPRRTAYNTYMDDPTALSWIPFNRMIAFGGIILFIGVIMVIYIVLELAFFAEKGEEQFPVAEVSEHPGRTPAILENWKLWVGILVFLIIMAYAVPVMDMIHTDSPWSKPWVTW